MSRNVKNKKKKMVRLFLEYGIHLWIIIFVSNIVIFYGLRFFIQASELDAGNTPSIEILSPTIQEVSGQTSSNTPTPALILPTPTPRGPVLSLSLTMPGISTVGGNIKPLRPSREIFVYLFKPDANTADKNVKPLYKFRSKAVYDDNPGNETYTRFINNFLDLGEGVKQGQYQIGIKSQQTLMELIRDEDPRVTGGKIFRIDESARRRPITLPELTLITGDIFPVPNSDNLMNIDDYNMLKDCFGIKAETTTCPSGSTADLDDNGIVDGIDYNLMTLSFQRLKERGYPIPKLEEKNIIIINPILPTPLAKIKEILQKPSPKPTPSQARPSGNIISTILLWFGILLFIGGLIFAVVKFKLIGKLKLPWRGAGAQPEPEATQTAGIAGDMPVQNTSLESPQEPQVVLEAPTKLAGTHEPVAESSSNIGSPGQGNVEKSGYLKKVSTEETNGGTWVTIADDSGITRGFYKGTDVTDGFVKATGIMKTDEENRPYIEISKIDSQ